MASSNTIQHFYFHESGISPNRRINFEVNQTVTATVEAKALGKWKQIGKLGEKAMVIEGATADENLEIFIKAPRKKLKVSCHRG